MIEYAVQASSISLSWLILPGRKGQSTTGFGGFGGFGVNTNGARADELAAQDDHNGAASETASFQDLNANEIFCTLVPFTAQDGRAVVAGQPPRETDQDRREGHQPRPLRYTPTGRSRGFAADVHPHSDVDRPTARTACAGMSN
jgi:hypothetical protein